MKVVPSLAVLLSLAACVPQPGVVSEFNGSSVKIQQDTTITIPQVTPQIEAEAARICGTAGKRAEYASTISAPSAAYADHLYLCL